MTEYRQVFETATEKANEIADNVLLAGYQMLLHELSKNADDADAIIKMAAIILEAEKRGINIDELF